MGGLELVDRARLGYFESRLTYPSPICVVEGGQIASSIKAAAIQAAGSRKRVCCPLGHCFGGACPDYPFLAISVIVVAAGS